MRRRRMMKCIIVSLRSLNRNYSAWVCLSLPLLEIKQGGGDGKRNKIDELPQVLADDDLPIITVGAAT
jgi:hypothetical protein